MRSATAPPVPAVEQTLALFGPARRPAVPHVEGGYLDLLGEEDPTGAHPGQWLMLSSALALIYERLWRPVGFTNSASVLQAAHAYSWMSPPSRSRRLTPAWCRGRSGIT
jgi:hypothetical protein